MLVDRSARVWAMRRDDVVAAQALQIRAARAEGQPVALLGGEPLEGSDFARVLNGVAIVPVKGPLMRSFSWWAWSYEEVLRDVRLAQADSSVRGIVLDIDSPGGLVAGCEDCAAEIRASGPKPVEAFVGGMGASAAYWLAASAGRVNVGSGAILGSIGSVIEYIDLEPYFEKLGARIVRVVAEQSPNKRLDPDSPEGAAELQALVDASGADFVAAVAGFRNTTEERVMAEFGQGLVFDGAEAIRRGMADRRIKLDDLIAELAGRDPTMTAAPAAAAQETPMDWANLTLAALREHRADLVDEITTAATAAATEAAGAESRQAAESAAAAERARIIGLDDVAVAGHEDLLAAAKADGKTTAAELALQILKAEKAAGSGFLAARQAADAAAAVPAAPPASSTPTGGAIEDQAKAAWDKDDKLRAEFGGDFDAYLAFEKAAQSGRARILASRAH